MDVRCKFEHEEDCCNSGSPQYMCKCKPDVCNSVVPITNADRIRSMSDEELAQWICGNNTPDFCEQKCPVRDSCKFGEVELLVEWLQQPAEED